VGEDIYGTVARCPRIVDAMEQLFGDEVYHYHSKMSIKEPILAVPGRGIRITVTGI